MKEEDIKADPQRMINDNDAFYQWILETFAINDILGISGVWELASEEFNNAWIEHCENVHEITE